ncbi:MAG: ATP-binding cassette domain-containing protein [Siphonobacter sp.]
MHITLDQLGKRFIREWIFRRLTLDILPGTRLAVTGPNGSGKSTLLQVIAGSMPATEGKLLYRTKNQKILEEDHYFRQVVIAAPYLELIEEFTLTELVEFHQKFKPFKQSLSTIDFIERVDLTASREKFIRNFSSGMKQRLKLGLAFWSDVPVVLLDEPTSNLDARNTDWYLREVQQLSPQQTVILCSNVPAEYTFCNQVLDILQYK